MIDRWMMFWTNLEWERISQCSSRAKRHRYVRHVRFHRLNTIEDAEVEDVRAEIRKRIPTGKGREFEVQRFKDNRRNALSNLTKRMKTIVIQLEECLTSESTITKAR